MNQPPNPNPTQKPSSFNITTKQVAVSNPPNGNGITRADPGQAQVVERTRTIAPITKFNTESGMVEADPESPWGGQAQPSEETPAPVEAPTAPATPDRRAAWREQQAKQATERERVKAEALEKRQPLARDFLKKGDLAGAAKALGMSPAEFREYAQNVLLTIPTPDKELTPEQRLEADREKVRQDQEALSKRQAELEYVTTADRYIRDKIRPVLSDKEKYEFLAQEDSQRIEATIYQFMDAHFRKTKEELDPADVAEEMEKALETQFTQTVERRKGLKKVSKLFANPTAGVADVATEEVPEPRKVAVSAPQLSTEVEEEVDNPPPKQAVVRRHETGEKVPFAFLDREERLRRLREGA